MKIKFTPCAAIAALYILLISAAAAQTAGPAISLTRPSAASLETVETSITLSGSATTGSGLMRVYCVDQFSERHEGSLGDGGQHGAASWTVPDIVLHPGVNLLTVTVVDADNRSASLHLAVNQKPAPDATPNSARKVASGMLQNRPVVYQIWNGQALVEGDMIVHPATRGISPEFAINYTSQLWPSVSGVHQVPYTVNGTAANLTTALANFNQDFSGLIQFVPCSAPPNTTCSLPAYVAISVSGGGAEGSSYVGVAPAPYQPQPLTCGSACTVATWLHEMGHTIGLLHEHQRPDRGNYITLNLANADLPNVPGNFTLFSYDNQITGLYDYASVMHYCAFCFSKAGQPVLESIPAGIPLSNNVGYSAGDFDQIQRLYGAAPSSVTVTTNPAGLQIIVDGTTYTAPHTFSNFALNSTHTLALPADPQYTNPVDGSTYAFGNWNDLGASSHTIYINPGSGALASPAKKPAVTLYEANYIRLQPFAFLSPPAYPTGSGTVSVTPAPTAEFGGAFFVDRTLVSVKYTKNPGYNFYDWYNLPFPPSDNPHSFYIQSPTTSAQAVFAPAANPVTIVGESITGTNTWNPLLFGYIDSVWTILPAGFTAFNGYNSTWTPGSTHSVGVDQQQSPVTTNIYYDWNSWSDSGTMAHNIVQPATGSQTISASFTPFYATYTLSNCGGEVTTFPAPAASYPANPGRDFYEEGTSVMSTATANSAYPEMAFAGWTGSTGGLAGRTDPQTVTIHGQFVPTANFNIKPASGSATPLVITSLTPASAVASATAVPAITVKGTGFVSGYTFAYWNGSYRALSGVTPTQFTMQLQAGDLTNSGGQDVYVGNYTAAPQGCSAAAETSFTVDSTARGKATTVVTLTPAALTFAATAVGSSSAPQTLTLKNTGTATLAIGSIAVWGPNASSFTMGSNTCTATLAAAASCTFTAALAPTVAGALTGTIAISDNASGSPQTVALKGTGTAPAVSLTPAATTFAATAVGSTSAKATITLRNTGTATLSIASIAIGGANSSSFIIQSNSCGSTLAAAASCAIGVAFKPAALGALTGTVAVTDNAAGSPQTVTLRGTGN